MEGNAFVKDYKAPWSASLFVISSLATLICLGVAISMIWGPNGLLRWVAMLPVAILVGGALFTIRGYTVTPDAILVRRLLWTTRLPLAHLRSAQFQPNVMHRSIRTFGNGGLFSFAGRFRNKALGSYRALVTDPHRSVVLQFSTGTVVVSPSAPEEFIQEVAAAASDTP